MFAALPEWLQGNVALGSFVVLLIVALAVIRMVQKFATRLILLGGLVIVAFSIAIQRDDIERCGRTCSCEIYTLDVTLPFCDPEFPGS